MRDHHHKDVPVRQTARPVPQNSNMGGWIADPEDIGTSDVLYPSVSFAAYAAEEVVPPIASLLETLKLAGSRPGQTEPAGEHDAPPVYSMRSWRKMDKKEIREYYDGILIHLKRMDDTVKHRNSSCGMTPRKGFLSFEGFQMAMKAGCSPCPECLVAYIDVVSPRTEEEQQP